MNTAKEKLKVIVRGYVTEFPNEYERFKLSMREKLSKNTSAFGEMKGSEIIERKLFEIPENLYYGIQKVLDPDEFEWFRSKDGSRWFAKFFKVFRSSERI